MGCYRVCWTWTSAGKIELHAMSAHITLLHGVVVFLLATGTLGAFAASYAVWVVKCATPEGRAAQHLAARRVEAALAVIWPARR
jgi:hypothetical protein